MTDSRWDAVEQLRDLADVAEAAVTELGPARGKLSAEDIGRLRILRAQLARADEVLGLELLLTEGEPEQ